MPRWKYVLYIVMFYFQLILILFLFFESFHKEIASQALQNKFEALQSQQSTLQLQIKTSGIRIQNLESVNSQLQKRYDRVFEQVSNIYKKNTPKR